jgi:hypothetical protein
MFVKVEADRGEDLGIVLSKTHVEEFEETIPTAGYRGRGYSNGQVDRKLILRLATVQEKLMLAEKVDDEEKVLAVSFNYIKLQQKCLLINIYIMLGYSR